MEIKTCPDFDTDPKAKTEPKVERIAYTVSEFCERNGICRATFYNLQKRGQGPQTITIGTHSRVTVQAEADWHRRMAKSSENTKVAA